MRPTDVDYDGALSASYEQGRRLSADAVTTWRRAVEVHVPDHGAIVDVGAGTGRFARELDTVAPRRVVAVEPSAGMRASATRPIASQVSWLAGSAEALPLTDASAGLVWSVFTTHYFDLDAAAAEFVRVLRPGGRAPIWHAFPDVFDDLESFRWFPAARAIDEKRMLSAASVRLAFEPVGFGFLGRTVHQMRIADNLASLTDRSRR